MSAFFGGGGSISNLNGIVYGVEAVTASTSITSAKSAKVFTNTGASGSVELTLPAATGTGVTFIAIVTAAQTFGFRAVGSDTITVGATTSAAAGSTTTNTIGRVVQLVDAVSGKWIASSFSGTWTTA